MTTGDRKIRLLIADDHTLFRSGLVGLLKTDEDFLIVGEAGNGQELVQNYFSTIPLPDIAIVDISMPVLSGLEATKEIISRDKSAKILFLSVYDDQEYIYPCVKAGGKGLVNKSITKEKLAYAIKKVHNGSEYFSFEINRDNLKKIIEDEKSLFSNKTIRPKDNLSFREEQILNLIGESLTTKEIAKKLNLSKRTIDAYRVNIINKLNLKNLPELIKYAIFHSLKQVE